MPNTPRNSDGTMRRANKPKGLTNRSIIARWVEAETLHLKRLGMGYQAIADHLQLSGHCFVLDYVQRKGNLLCEDFTKLIFLLVVEQVERVGGFEHRSRAFLRAGKGERKE